MVSLRRTYVRITKTHLLTVKCDPPKRSRDNPMALCKTPPPVRGCAHAPAPGGSRMPRRSNAIAYEQDLVAWLEDQSQHLRRGEIGALDLENIAEELEAMARRERREIRDRVTVLLIQLLKCQVQPTRQSRSLIAT